MSRHKGLNRAYASVSVMAVLGLLAGCSQPASYATVDLGGSYGNAAPQGYSALSGLPVYQATQVYTTPAAPYSPSQPQLVYRDAPANQVASLSPGYGSYGQLQQSYPVFDSVAQGTILTDETILRSDGYIDVGPYGGQQTAVLSPGVGSIGFEQAPVMTDVPRYAPAPVQQSYAPQAFEPPPYSEPVQTAPLTTALLPPPAPMQPAPLQVAPIYEPLAAPVQAAPLQAAPLQAAPVAQPDLFAAQPARDDVQGVIDYYDIGNPATRAPAPQNVALSAPQPAPLQAAPIQAAPSQSAPVSQIAPAGDIALPPASQAYPRPYEALPPGFFPTYEFPSENDFISQAPAPAPVEVAELLNPVLTGNTLTANDGIVVAPTPRIEQASVATVPGFRYTIQPGDTLYAIARMHGVTPRAIAMANGLPMAGTIYAGNTLTIPTGGRGTGRPETLGDAPIVVLQSAEAMPAPVATMPLPVTSPAPFVADAASINTYTTDLTGQSGDTITIDELARMFRDRENGMPGAAMPVISAQTGEALRGRVDLTPTEIISDPIGARMGPTVIMPMAEVAAMAAPAPSARPSYAWPVQGDVFRLPAGGIEIGAPAGQPVTAAAGGRVVHVEDGPRGTLVVVEHADGWRSLTLGMREAVVQVGQTVPAGGTLGITDGRRITFELRDGASNVAEALGILQG